MDTQSPRGVMRRVNSNGELSPRSDTFRGVADSVTGAMVGEIGWSTATLPAWSPRMSDATYVAVPVSTAGAMRSDGEMLASALHRGDYTLACALATEPADRMRVEHAILAEQSMAAVVPPPPPSPCASLAACLARCRCAESAPPPPPSTEFKMAIRGRDWTLARALARTDAERRDVAHSIMRVNAIETHVERGEYDSAIELAILRSELDDLRERKANPAPHYRSPSGCSLGRQSRGMSGESSVGRGWVPNRRAPAFRNICRVRTATHPLDYASLTPTHYGPVHYSALRDQLCVVISFVCSDATMFSARGSPSRRRKAARRPRGSTRCRCRSGSLR